MSDGWLIDGRAAREDTHQSVFGVPWHDKTEASESRDIGPNGAGRTQREQNQERKESRRQSQSRIKRRSLQLSSAKYCISMRTPWWYGS